MCSTSVPSSRPEPSRERHPLHDPHADRNPYGGIPRPPIFDDPLAGDEPYGG